MSTQRRQISPREVLDRGFQDAIRCVTAALSADKTDSDLGDMALEGLEDLRRFAVSTADGAPPPCAGLVEGLVAAGDAARMSRFVSRHLERQIPYLDIKGVPPVTLAAAAMEALRGPGELADLARDVIAKFPEIQNPDLSAWKLEGVMREALGMDGRVPDPDSNPDIEAWSGLRLRMAIAHHPGDVAPDATATAFPDFERLEGAFAAIGLPDPRDGMTRDEIYHVALDHIMRDTVRRIERLAGGQIDPEVGDVLMEVIRRASSHAGPKLQIEMPEP